MQTTSQEMRSGAAQTSRGRVPDELPCGSEVRTGRVRRTQGTFFPNGT